MRFASTIVLVGILFLSFLTAFHPIETCSAAGTTIYVDDSGGANYTEIQDAIDAANEGDTIYVYSGTYSEYIVIDKTLTLIGENKGNTYISNPESNKDTVTADNVFNVNISGFEIVQNPTAQSNQYHSIYINHGDYCSITECNVKDGNIGIWVKNSDGCTISSNTIEGNNFAGVSISIYSDNNIVFDNTFSQNEKGIYIITDSNSNVLHHNTFQNNDRHAYDECNNQWDDGSEGNYWDDYGGYDNNSNNIGDTPYNIPGDSNQDRYPLGFFTGENQKPTAHIDSISPNPATQGQTITFSGHGEDSDGSIKGYKWRSSKNGQLSTQASFSTSSLSVGTHTIFFKVKDNDEDWSTEDTQTLEIEPSGGQEDQKPTAEIVTINPSETTYGTSVFFHGLGKDFQGMITAYSWRSSIDGVLSEQATFTKFNLSVGDHTIYFKVQDANGWSDEDSATLVINPDPSSPNEPPIADAGGPYFGYVNVSLAFDASDSYDPDGDNIVNYSWDFGDGDIGYGMIVEHAYTASGTYTVNLTIKDSRGGTATNSTYASITIQSNGQNGNDEENGTTPGFEILFFMLAIALILLKKKKRE